MKQDISCRHCGKITKWYISMINEIGYQEFEGKIYCDECLNRIGHFALDN